MTLEVQFTNNLNSCKGIVYTVINKYCASLIYRQSDLFDDIYQEISIQAWKAYPAFRGECKFSSWLYTISYRTCATIMRNHSVSPGRKVISVDTWLFTWKYGELADESSKPAKCPPSILSTLSPRERMAFDMYIDNKSYAQIADILDEPENRIRVRICRIRERLRFAVRTLQDN